MQEFNLQEAKDEKSVCTRDDKSVRITYFDFCMTSEKKTGWINIYESDNGQRNCNGVYDTMDEAIAADDKTTGGKRITTIQIEWEE